MFSVLCFIILSSFVWWFSQRFVVCSVSFVLFSLFYIAKLWITYCFVLYVRCFLVFLIVALNSSLFSPRCLYKWAVSCCSFVCCCFFPGFWDFCHCFLCDVIYMWVVFFLFRFCLCGIICVDYSSCFVVFVLAVCGLSFLLLSLMFCKCCTCIWILLCFVVCVLFYTRCMSVVLCFIAFLLTFVLCLRIHLELLFSTFVWIEYQR